MSKYDFRTDQVLGDLARAIGDGVVLDAWQGARNPTSPEQVWAALAAILFDAVASGQKDAALDQFWHDQADRIRTAPAPVRAALMNGFAHLCDDGLIPEECRPLQEDLITRPRPQIEQALMAIARQMTVEERDQVSRADYGCDAARHLIALEVLLNSDDLAYPPGEVWFPAEVVELVSHVPGEIGHIPCLAIVLLDAVRNGDLQGYADYRFANQIARIEQMDAPVRDVFLAAFRHLYESDRSWNPVPSDPDLSGAIYRTTLPWTAGP